MGRLRHKQESFAPTSPKMGHPVSDCQGSPMALDAQYFNPSHLKWLPWGREGSELSGLGEQILGARSTEGNLEEES